jgi:uncharacterized surface protein with fasciclin (FAS1) repeats
MRALRTRTRGLTAAVVTATFALATGCSSDDDATQASESTTTGSAAAPSATPAAGPFGPSCTEIPSDGPGSLTALAADPVATAASSSPVLSTLAAAVTEAGLAETLNSSEALTVFAPTNDAFAKIPEDTLAQVLADKEALTEILTYHVVGERYGPAELSAATIPTLQGGTVDTATSGDEYTVNDASVVCGNVQTRNATVYIIDTVLMPES